MRRIVALLPRLAAGRAGRFAKTDVFACAVDVVTADLQVRGESLAAIERLRAAIGGKRSKHERRARPEEV